MSSYGERAAELFGQGFNCAQSVAAAFAACFGYDTEQVLKMVMPLGGGIGRQREICGAVTGMCIVLGMAEGTGAPDPEAKKAVYEATRQLCNTFFEANGSIVCRDLLGLAANEKGGDPAPRTEEYYEKRPCKALVACAADIIERYLAEKGRL